MVGSNIAIKGNFEMKKMTLYINTLNKVLQGICNELERIATGADSPWSSSVLTDVIRPEIEELLDYADKGEIFFKYGKKQRLLQATYIMIDSLQPLFQTDLGQSISALQKLYYHL